MNKDKKEWLLAICEAIRKHVSRREVEDALKHLKELEEVIEYISPN